MDWNETLRYNSTAAAAETESKELERWTNYADNAFYGFWCTWASVLRLLVVSGSMRGVCVFMPRIARYIHSSFDWLSFRKMIFGLQFSLANCSESFRSWSSHCHCVPKKTKKNWQYFTTNVQSHYKLFAFPKSNGFEVLVLFFSLCWIEFDSKQFQKCKSMTRNASKKMQFIASMRPSCRCRPSSSRSMHRA